eukprot:2368582-Pyramimonas_sp.AAC.1
MCDPIAEWWGVSSTLLTRELALQKSGKDPTEAQKCLKGFCAMRTRLGDTKRQEYFGKKALSVDIDTWQAQAQSAPSLDLEQLQDLLESTHTWADRAQGRSLVKSRQAFMDWAKLMWSKSPGAVHRH